MFSQEDFPVSRSVMLGSDEARMMTAISGRICSSAFSKCSPLGSCVRMLLDSSRWWSKVRHLKWKVRPLYSKKITEYTDTDLKSPTPLNESVRALKVTVMKSNRCFQGPHRRDRVFIVGHLTYTNSKRCRRRTETDKGKENNLQQTLFSNSKRYGSRASFADANRELQQPRHNINEKRQEKTEMRPVKFTCGDNSKAGCGRWENFPIVAPVHRGNDGLPISLDDLTISKTKWREESIKAYGNAIVPQVIFEIYRAIDQVEREGH